MTHKINGKYQEGTCFTEISGGVPYLILNLEMFYALKDELEGSHCDFVYICKKDDKFRILMVELKGGLDNENVLREITNIFTSKFPSTLHTIKKYISSYFNISNGPLEYIAILVLPEQYTKIKALLRHKKTTIRPPKEFNRAWISTCSTNVWKPEISIK